MQTGDITPTPTPASEAPVSQKASRPAPSEPAPATPTSAAEAELAAHDLGPCPTFRPPSIRGRIAPRDIDEASGLVASRKHQNIVWVHNDSGDQARLFAVRKDGSLAGVFTSPTLQAIDWEDIAIGPGPSHAPEPHLYVADMGDNGRRRKEVFIHRVPEPALPENADEVYQGRLGPAETFRVRYPDGPHDAETLLVAPDTGEVVVLTKSLLRPPRIFFAKELRRPFTTLEAAGTFDLEAAGILALLPTAGDVSPDGRWVIVRSYDAAYLFRRNPGQPLWHVFKYPACSIPLAREPQGEALGFAADGSGYFSLSERRHQPLYFYAFEGGLAD